jgi:hypothetical protein
MANHVELGWKGRENAELLDAAKAAGFEVLVIADRNLRFQQNLSGPRTAIVELWTNCRPTLERNLALVAAAVASAKPDAYIFTSSP